MKTFGTILSAAFVLMPWIIEPLYSQQNTSPASEKKITITKRTVDQDGSETTEVIVKKGKAAQNFDVEKYINENRSDNTQVEVRVESGTEDEKSIIVKRTPGADDNDDHDYDYNYDYK